jgi:hypothetical protein
MEKYVKIINIIDKSGSMKDMLDAAINGFNSFLEEQKSVEGKALVSTILFNSDYQILYENMDIQNCTYFNKENYVPKNSTALYDSIGRTLENEVDRLGGMSIEERPEKTLCIILTDGFENASKNYSQQKIKTMITEMREDFKWEFLFLGADENASLTAQSMGISAGNSYAFMNTNDGLKDAYRGISNSSKVYRMSKSVVNDNLMDSYREENKKDK